MIEERIDKIILKLFPKYTRSKIQTLIAKGKVFYKKENRWIKVTKSSHKLPLSDIKQIDWKFEQDEEMNYVSRGALKLKEAVEKFQIPVKGTLCLDIGLSTGGFSDYLLQEGAKKILGIDVGREQLHSSLREIPELLWKDKINGREELSKELLADFFQKEEKSKFDLIVIDVSFISLDKIVTHLHKYIDEKGSIIALVKPQFELSRSDLNKKGVVKDFSLINQVLQKISRVLSENKLELKAECSSPIEGDNGNKEVLILAQPT